MRVALYDPEGGYFATGPLRSTREGDFLTSPEVSRLFGETIARFVASEGERIEADPVDVIEVGAGTGSLLRPLLEGLDRPARVVAVEASAAARTSLAERVPEATIVTSLDEVGPVRGVIVANELIDNLPVALAVRRGHEWAERWVGAEGGELVYVDVPVRPEVAEWCDAHAGPVPEGGRVEVQLAAGEWLRSAARILEGGSILLFDYGDTGEGLERRRAEGTLRTYRGHHLGPDPLLEPGATDITVDVDVGALVAVARSCDLDVELTTQAEFLEAWGLGERLRALRQEELELARGSDAMARLEVRSAWSEGQTLLHPRGLGDFRALTVRRPNRTGEGSDKVGHPLPSGA